MKTMSRQQTIALAIVQGFVALAGFVILVVIRPVPVISIMLFLTMFGALLMCAHTSLRAASWPQAKSRYEFERSIYADGAPPSENPKTFDPATYWPRRKLELEAFEASLQSKGR